MKQESIVPRIITAVLTVLLGAYIGYQAYLAFYKPVRTVGAVFTEVDDSIQTEGYIVRDESLLIKNFGTGVLEMNVYEGERVANGDTVAVVFADEEAAKKNHEEADINEQINMITTLYSQSGESYDINAANNKISEHAIAIEEKNQEGIVSDFESVTDDLKLQTLMREYIYRDKSELLAVLEELKARKASLGSSSSVVKRIYAPHTGYFSQNTDGYESILGSDFALSATPSDFLSVDDKYATPAENTIGKLISNNIWYFATVLDEENTKRLKVGTDVLLKFQDKSLPTVESEVARLSDPENGKVLVVFECNTHIGNFTKARKIVAQVVINTYSGLKVPREALRVDESGQNGVYCLIDSQVKFKPIEIIFEKDSYYIARYNAADTKSLLLYDEIVVSAKNLENKKIVK